MNTEHNKDKCKKIMLNLFGPACAKAVDRMDESECIAICREKVRKLLGNKKAERFDDLYL